MSFAGHSGCDASGSYILSGSNIIDAFNRLGWHTVGTGSVSWFDTSTPTGSVLSADFEHFFYSGNTWSLDTQLHWIKTVLSTLDTARPIFLFLNIGETHVPYWHEGALWPKYPSPCVPFGDQSSSTEQCRFRQLSCLEWVDSRLNWLITLFRASTILACADHGDCWGEDGLWEHGVSHPSTLTVPLILRVRGAPVN